MIIIGDKKKVLTQILGPEDAEVAEEGETPLHSCVRELIDCVHNKDVEGAAAAFKACFASCEAEPHAEYGE